MEFYTKFLNYKLENVRQRPMDWLAFLERKRTELVNTGHIMDDETFITHLLNSLPQAECEGAILAIKERLRRSTYDLAEIEQILEDKYQSMKYVKGWEEEEDNYVLFASPANKKGHKNSSKDNVAIVESLDTKQRIALTRKAARKRVQRINLKKRRHKRLKGTTKERVSLICQKIDATIVVKWVILHRTAQSHVRTLILLKKMSKTGNLLK